MRALLDANVLVSARIKATGESGKILNQAVARYDLLLPDFLLDKVDEVLRRSRIQKKYPHITEQAIREYLTTLRELGEPVIEQTTLESTPDTSEDSEDLLVLAAAVDGNAEYLVTYNTSHFPETYQHTETHQNITILLPKSFSQMLVPQPASDQGDDTSSP